VLLEIDASFGIVLAMGMMQRTPRSENLGGGSAPRPAQRSNAKALEAGRKPMTFKVRKDGTYVIDG